MLAFLQDTEDVSELRALPTWKVHRLGGDRKGNPPHPGAFIRTEILEPLELSVTAAAQVLGVSRPTLSSLLNGQADLSGNMALRLEKAFGVRMETLMRMQASYDIVQTRTREKSITVRRYRRPAASTRQPIRRAASSTPASISVVTRQIHFSHGGVIGCRRPNS